MVFALIGESCTGKSSIADSLSASITARVYSGKDYLKLAKSEPEARKAFMETLRLHESAQEHIIYVITEREHLAMLPEKAVRVLVTAELETIKERFAKRMGGNLPVSVAGMLEKKHGMFDSERYDLRIDSTDSNAGEASAKIAELISGNG